MLLILSPQNSPRLDYVCHVIFKRILSLDYAITQDEDLYGRHTDFKLRYLPKSNLLFETDIRRQDENLIMQDRPALAFYLLSSYEEYLPDCPRDQHGRMVHEQLFVVRHGLFHQAAVQRIALQYKTLLSKQQPAFKWEEPTYRFLPTFDIDIAYAFKGKHLFHFCGALGKALFTLQWGRAVQIIKAQCQADYQDPHDVYDIERQLCEKHGTKALCFMLTSRRTRFDRNISPQSKQFPLLLQQLQQFATIGLHSSYYSDVKHSIKKEKQNLEQKGGITVNCSRQHFLKVRFPDTFRQLIAAGISDDYSLGFHDRIGFRNGMAQPFPFYDMAANEATSLMLYPLLMMDSAAVQSLGYGESYWAGVEELIQEVKTVGGDMTALWHSNFMPHGSKQLELFRKTFERMC